MTALLAAIALAVVINIAVWLDARRRRRNRNEARRDMQRACEWAQEGR